MIISDADTATARASRPVLPDGLSFNHLVELIERHACLAFGIGFARREALLRMMRSTAVKDWTDPGRDPVPHAAHPERHHEAAGPAHRQPVHRRGTGVAGVDDDVGAVGQQFVEQGDGVAVPDAGAVVRRRLKFGVRQRVEDP